MYLNWNNTTNIFIISYILLSFLIYYTRLKACEISRQNMRNSENGGHIVLGTMPWLMLMHDRLSLNFHPKILYNRTNADILNSWLNQLINKKKLYVSIVEDIVNTFNQVQLKFQKEVANLARELPMSSI